MKEAMFYEKVDGKKVRCVLCGRRCVISEGKFGACGVRKNVDGRLYSLNYKKICSIAIDPIEKKPLFHFAPGSSALSIASVGCNFKCKFCQNWEISQEYGSVWGREVEPEKLVEIALENNAQGIAYTYTEPTIFYEYAYETMKVARREKLYNVWVSNGYTSTEAIKKMARYLHAVNVDFKGSDEFYRKLCLVQSASPVMKAMKAYKESNVWVEVTTLVIPGYNDDEKTLMEIASWVARNLGKNTPLHLSKFHPDYRLLDTPPTPEETLMRAYEIARSEGLRYVYVGNVFGHKHESTYCPECGELLIKRLGFQVLSLSDKCKKCGESVPIKGKKWSAFR